MLIKKKHVSDISVFWPYQKKTPETPSDCNINVTCIVFSAINLANFGKCFLGNEGDASWMRLQEVVGCLLLH